MDGKLAAMPSAEKATVLEFENSIWLPDELLFIAKDNFKVDTSPTAKVKIAKISPSFIALTDPLRDTRLPGRHLNTWRLKKSARDSSIIGALGKANYETRAADLWKLLSMQSDGGAGLLLTDGKVNMFYIKSKSDDIKVVRARYQSGNKAWHLDTFPFDDPLAWGSGRLIITYG